MRRKRRHLQVTTFPFMAVLLCAMGSLILLLLIMDRQAKLAARAKALQAQKESDAQRLKHEADLRAKHEAEWQRQKEELHARLLQLDQAVLAELKQVRAKERNIQSQLVHHQQKITALRTQLQREQSELELAAAELEKRGMAVATIDDATGQAQQAVAKLKKQFDEIELALDRLKKLRQQRQARFSLIPYAGKRGDNRLPIYAECTNSGIVFHPRRAAFEGSRFSPLLVRSELELRIKEIEEKAAKIGAETKPYLFLLVRPDGLESYYAMQAVLAGLKIDFGYELVDAGWAFDFTDSPATPLTSAPPRVVQGTGDGGSQNGRRVPAGYRSHGSPNGRQVPAGYRSHESFVGTENASLPGGRLGKPKPADAQWQGGVAKTSPKGTMPDNRQLPPTRKVEKGTSAGNSGEAASETVAVSPEKTQLPNPLPDQENGPGLPSSEFNVEVGPIARKPPIPLGRLTANRDWIIAIECGRDDVHVPIAHQRFSVQELLIQQPGKEHALTRTIRELVANRQALVRPGEPPYRPVLRFEIAPDGLRLYHLAYPLLEPLNLPMVRENVQPPPPDLTDYYRKN